MLRGRVQRRGEHCVVGITGVVADTVVYAPPQHEQNLKYVIRGTDSQIVELVAGGAAKPVPFSERDKWAELAKNYRIHEFDLQVRERERECCLVVWTTKKCLQALEGGCCLVPTVCPHCERVG